jgi:predicted  nucleic acid-binding Zn-ribbon protein
MTQRDALRQKLDAKLKEHRAEIDKLQARFAGARADAKLETKQKIAELKAMVSKAETKLQELGRAGEDAWHDMGSGLEKVWADLGSAIDSAKARFQ